MQRCFLLRLNPVFCSFVQKSYLKASAPVVMLVYAWTDPRMLEFTVNVHRDIMELFVNTVIIMIMHSCYIILLSGMSAHH